MSRRSGRVVALTQRQELLALQKRLDDEEAEAAALRQDVMEDVDPDDVEILDAPLASPSSKPANPVELAVSSKLTRRVKHVAPASKVEEVKESLAVEIELAVSIKEDGEEEEEEEAEDDDGDDDYAARKKPSQRKQLNAPKAKVKANAKAKASAKSPSSRSKKARPVSNGGADDPIELSDGDADDAAKKKKPAKPKKTKPVPVIERIREVHTAQPYTRKLIGAHVSSSGGVQFAPHNAALMGCRAFAMDTRSKRRWVSPAYTEENLAQFQATMAHYGYSGEVVLPHGSYLMNLGSTSDELYEKSKQCLREELERCEQLGIRMYNFHPGRYALPEKEREEAKRIEKEQKKARRERERDRARRRKKGEEVSDSDDDADDDDGEGATDTAVHEELSSPRDAFLPSQYHQQSLQRLIDALNWAHTLPSCAHVCIVLETMAGSSSGTTLGAAFEELHYVIERVHDKERIGVCVDTCHVFAASPRYDLRDRATYGRLMAQLESVIGWRYVKAMHMNDSKMPLGSRRDRHENIGDGEIGLEAFRLIMNDPRWDGIPLLLETPCRTEEKDRLKREKKLLKERGIKEEPKAKAKAKRKAGEDDDDDEDDEEEEGAKKPKEKEDWVKSYSDEIDMVYGLEESTVKGEDDGVKVEHTGVKAEVS